MMRIPILPTIIVAAAVTVMIALGFWQLDRLGQKEALIERAERSLANSEAIPWPRSNQSEAALYRRSSVTCLDVQSIDSRAGRSKSGSAGWMHMARCSLEGGGVAEIAIGWSVRPEPPPWPGGTVDGVIGPYGDGIRLIATEPVAGLDVLAPPDPSDLSNNHLAYAGQWFFFALTALVIYVLALRRRKFPTDGVGTNLRQT